MERQEVSAKNRYEEEPKRNFQTEKYNYQKHTNSLDRLNTRTEVTKETIRKLKDQ